MFMLMVLPTLTGLLLALTTFRAGLPLFAFAISAFLVTGLGLLSHEDYAAGFALYLLAIVLILLSKNIMDRYEVGPYSKDRNN